MSINTTHIQERLNKVNSAVKQLAENKYKQPKGKLIEQLLQLKEIKNSLNKKLTETKTAFIKGKSGITTAINYNNDTELRKLAPNSDLTDIDTASGQHIKEQEGNKPYTEEESEAVGNSILPKLEAAIRAEKGELAGIPTVKGKVNGFTIHTIYGHNKGEDLFKFTLDPKVAILYYGEGANKKKVSTFKITEANEVTLYSADVQNTLEVLLSKYPPAPINYTNQSPDESQISEFISKRKLALKETLGKNASVGDYIKDFETSKKPQFKGKSKEKLRQMAIAASYNKDESITKEELDEIMLEAYVELLKEQGEDQIPQIPEVPTEPVTPTPEKKPIPRVVKYELGKVIDSLFGSSHMDFVEKIQLAVPNPSEFQVFLKNGQSFYLKWMGKSPEQTTEESNDEGIEHLGQEVKGAFMAEIESKKYYLGSLPQYEQALDKLGDLLKNGILTQGEVPGEAAFQEPTGGGSTGGSTGGGTEAGGGETFPEVPEEAPTNAAGTGPEIANAFEEEPTPNL